MKIVANTSLPAVNCSNADRWNAARSRQKEKKIMAFLVATTGLPVGGIENRNSIKIVFQHLLNLVLGKVKKMMVLAITVPEQSQ